MSCKPTYKGKRYNSLEELYNANGVNIQQAQQLYSQYLDTIFPDSKVKDIVYHLGAENIEEFKNRSERDYELFGKKGKIILNGIYFGGINNKDTINPRFDNSKKKYAVILNIKNPEYKKKKYTAGISDEKLEKYKNQKLDSVISNEGDITTREYVVFESNQVHILGSKQDIEGFKEFIGKTSIEDASISEVPNFLPLQGNEALYKNYNLLNKQGKLKVIKSKKIGDKWVKALNKSPYYHFVLRQIATNEYRILISAEPKMQPSEDFSISELQTQSTKVNSQGLLITDGDYTFDADKQRQVVGNIGYLVYTDLLEAAKTGEVRRVTEAFKNAKVELQNYKDALDHMASLETEGELLLLIEEYPVYSYIDSLDKAKFLAEEVGRILKDEVWRQFQEQVKVELKAKGIVVKNEKLLDLSVFGKEELAEIGIEDVIEDNDFQSEKNYSIETFQIDPKNTASINVKLMLSKIEDTTVNYLGLNSYIPFDTVFDELKMMLAPLEGDLDAYIKEIEQIANNNSSKGYLNNLITYLKDPNTATQIKNNFVAVMNSHDTNFIMLLWKLEEGKGYQARLINSNRNNAEYRVVEQWAENIKKSGISKFDPTTGERIIDVEKAKALKEEMLALANVEDINVYKAFLTKLETMLGMSIPASAKKILYETVSYNTLLNNKFERKGNFQDQFRWTKDDKPSGVFSALVHALTDKVTNEQIEEVDFKIEVNNPFEGPNKESAARFLAALVANHSETMFSSSFKNVEGKTIYGFSYHIPITSRLKEFNKGTELRNILKKYAFSKDAFWLSNNSFKVHFEDMDGIKHNAKNSDGIVRNKMSDREQEFTSMMFFQQPSTEIAKFVGLTMSDKTRSPIIEVPKFKVFLDTDELNGVKVTKEALSQSTKDEIAKLVKSEAARIVLIHDKIKNAKDNNTTEELMQELGPQYYYGSQYFYFFPQLNDILYKDGVMQADMLVSEDLNILIESALDSVVNTINETVDFWLAEGIVEIIPNKKGKNSVKHKFNKEYVNSKNTTGYSAESLVAFAAADLEINYLLFNANMMQVVQGDPALYYAPKFNKVDSIQKRIEMVMDEYQKREAKDAAPGELGSLNWTITSPTGEQYLSKYTYNVVFALDDNHGTLTEGYLSKIPAYTSKLDRTDAQEYTTVLEHINVLANHGRIPDDVYSAIRSKIEKAGKGGYYTLSKEELDIILQPMKPVQVVHKAKETHEHSYYIKSSSFPLVPQLTEGLDLDKIRVAMEKGDVDRIAFVTATKTGYHNTVSLFNSDGTVKENLEFQPQEKHQLHRKGFSIQQDVPYDSTKHEITVVSQMDRLILQGLSDEIFSFNGHKDYTGKTLKALKENIRGQLMDMSRKELFTKVGVEVVNGKPYVANMDKFLEGIREEARDRGWSVNDIMSLNIVDGKIVIPLAFNNSADRIESLIASMFNRVIKQKINGKSFVQASSSGFKNNVKTLDDLITDEKEGIIWIKGTDNDFDPKKGLTYVNKDNGKLAQVILPWKFQAEIKKFLVPETNTLDMTKVDKELLQIIGARIPNQGHSSQLSIQIVGFLPKLMGDLIIVPGEITKQMGSDFDVDKLYTYIFNHIVNDEGRLVKIPAFINREGELDSKAAREWVKTNFSKETMPSAKFLQRASLQNAYIGIHLAVLSNPKVMELMTEPLDADDLKTTGKVAQEAIDRGLFISRRRQLKDFKKQQAGKDGVAIFSRAVVGAAMIEDYNLRLTVQDDKGKRIDKPFTGFKEDGVEKPLQLGKLSGIGKSKFGDEIRTKIKNLIIQQSGAVDNAKDPVLAMNGLDPATFNVSIVISMLQDNKGNALNLEYNSYFLRQEIIKEYVAELKKLSDTLNDKFVPDRKGEAANIVREKFLKRLNITNYDVEGKAFSPRDLIKLLGSNEKNSNEYVKDQLEILEHFLYLDAVGQELSEIYTALSTESKGLGKNYWEVKLRQEQLEALDKKSIIAGASEILKDSQSGKIAGYVNDAISLLSHQFPYNTTTFNTIISTIENESGRTRTDVEFRQLMWENFKSFMFSNTELDTVIEDKNSLFYGDNSVAKQLKKYAETAEGKKNKFVQKLRVKTAVDANRPDLVLFNAAIAERTDEQELVKHFIDLIISPNEEVRNLAERLINYTYAIGGIQKALQFVKYVPVPYLMTTNFGSKLVELSNLMNEENNVIDSNRFIEQFYQHNPEKARKHNLDSKDVSVIYKNGLTFNIEIDNTQHLKKIENKKELFVEYISVRNVKKNKWILLKKESLEGNNLVYKPIPTLGGWGKDYIAYNEYDFNSDNVTSTIPENNPEGVAQVKVKTTPSSLKKEGEISIKNPIAIEVKAHEYVLPYPEGKESLDYMLSKLQTERFKVLSPIFLKSENIFSKFRIKVDNNLTGRDGNLVKGTRYSDNTIGINPKEHEKIAKVLGREVTNEDLERTLIHELVHVVTVDLYKKFYLEGADHPLLTPAVKKAFEQIETLFKVANNRLSDTDKKLVEALRKNTSAQMSIEDKTGLYGFTSVTEFMSEVLTKKEFQERLNKMEFNSQKTMLQRFTEFIQKIFNEFVKLIEQDLGTTIDQKSVLAHSLLEVVGLVNEIGNIQEVNKTDLTSSENVDGFLEFTEQTQKEIESNITTSPVFKQHGTDYRFQLRDGEAISGEYYQSGQGWRPMNPKNIKNKYKELLKNAEMSSMLETLSPKVEGGEKNVIVPEGSNPNNTIIFEDNNNIYLMNDGQQKAYDSVLEFLSDRILKTNEPLNLQELLKFVEGNNLAKEYSNVIPKQLWDNMIGIIGKGGTGKTTVIKKIIEDFIQKNRGNNRYFGVNVQFATPTHTAATVLQESLGVNSEGVRTGGVHTIASLTGRKELVDGSLNMISKETYLDEIKKGFRMPISKIQILVFDESSMFSIEHMQDIIRRLQEEKELGIEGTPIMIFMGDYRQLPPIQGNAKKPDLEGVISSTLFTHPDKYSELSQIMRSSEEDMHKVFDVVGNQITARRNAFIKGTTIPQFDWKKYDEVTSKSSKNVLIVNNEEGIIDDYTDELVNNDNPYHIFWIHYNKLDKPVTQNLFNKIRRNYFKKLGVTNIPETFIKGDYVQYMEPIETTTINDGNLGISAGTIKPQSRHKIKDIIKETVNFKDLLVAAKLDKFAPYFDSNITVTSGTLVLHNRQGKDRAIKFLDNIIATEEWIKSTTTRGKDVIVTLKTQDGKVITKSKPIPGYLVMQNPDVFKIFFKDVNKVFKPSYIGSSHTAQGNSIKTVIVGEYNIRENAAKGVPIKDILSSLYTALTRASKKIIIIKGSGINIVNNQETFTDFIDLPPIDSMDISNFPIEEEMSISPLPTQTKSLSLGITVSKFMNNLSKEQREVMRKMINKGQIKFKCS